MTYYFMSFCNKGKNTGVIQTKAIDERKALEQIKDIAPEYDDIMCFKMSEKEDIECDRLYSAEEMMARGNEKVSKEWIKENKAKYDHEAFRN